MKNQIRTYAINNSEVFEKMATLSGLTQPNTLIRLSKAQLDGLEDTIGCLTKAGIDAFINKYPNVSGDCYVSLTSDGNGDPVLALDILRPDLSGTVIDQDIIYIRKPPSGWTSASEARKLSHFDCEGRTFDLSAYRALSGYLDNRRDVPVSYDEISSYDPGLIKTISKGMESIDQKEAKQ